MSAPTYAVRNASDDSVIAYTRSEREAKRLQAEVVNGDFDGEPRDCWVDQVEFEEEP